MEAAAGLPRAPRASSHLMLFFALTTIHSIRLTLPEQHLTSRVL